LPLALARAWARLFAGWGAASAIGAAPITAGKASNASNNLCGASGADASEQPGCAEATGDVVKPQARSNDISEQYPRSRSVREYFLGDFRERVGRWLSMLHVCAQFPFRAQGT
jgi:hypothetical protein